MRGRLGLRVGTSHVAKDGTLVEPFVVGSVWGNFSGDNKATVTSLGTTFGPFKDEGDDVWGVLSGGLNVFSPSGRSSAFAKADWSFGDDARRLERQARHAPKLVTMNTPLPLRVRASRSGRRSHDVAKRDEWREG